jgi:4-hydroxy-3-polyprenylbenzoate decarboxylase
VLEASSSLTRPTRPATSALEGFGDHTGYYNQECLVSPSSASPCAATRLSLHLRQAAGRALFSAWRSTKCSHAAAKQFPEIVDFYRRRVSYRLAVVSMKSNIPATPSADVRRVELFAPVHVHPFIIVTDDDVDVRNWKEVVWAITTRVDPARVP